MAMFKSDSQGFLVGELIETNRDMLKAQAQGMTIWKTIRTDVKSIARALSVQVATTVRTSRPGGTPATRTSSGGTRSGGTRTAGGNYVASPGGRSGGGRQQAAAVTSSRGGARATVAVAVPQRAANGRFVAGQKRAGPSGDAPATPGDASSSGGSFSRLSDSIGKLSATLTATDNIDPTLNAAKEIQEVVAPLGRGLFGLFGRSSERRKERKQDAWYTKILKAITGKKSGGGEQGAASDGGFSISSLISMIPLVGAVAPILASIGSAILAGLGLMGALSLGAFIGNKIYEWLDKSGILIKIFDAFDSIKSWFTGKVEGVKNDYQKGKDQALQTGPQPPRLGADGRNINDPRRVDQQPIEPPKSVAQAAGRVVGAFQRGQDYMKGKGSRNVAENRALQTGADYAAGNIGGLDDAQTRALVASTALTESGGGKLGVVNSAGYMGRYQAGAGWLADAGQIAGGPASVKAAMKADGFTNEYKWGQSGGMTKFLKDDKNWNGGMTYDKYMGSATTQDAAFKTNSDAAYAQMMKNGTINANTPPEQIAGLLKARHLAGMGGAMAVARGGTGAVDANGTSAAKYYNDVALDKNGFGAAYRNGGAVASANIPSTPSARVPSAVPVSIPPLPDTPATPQKLNSDAGAGRGVVVNIPEKLGQNVGDRGIAHIVTGGLGVN